VSPIIMQERRWGGRRAKGQGKKLKNIEIEPSIGQENYSKKGKIAEPLTLKGEREGRNYQQKLYYGENLYEVSKGGKGVSERMIIEKKTT